jgi:hypothetical protein
MNPLVIKLDADPVIARAFETDSEARQYCSQIGGLLVQAESQLGDMTSAQLVTIYNTLTGEQIKKFSDKGTALSRIEKASFNTNVAEVETFDDGGVAAARAKDIMDGNVSDEPGLPGETVEQAQAASTPARGRGRPKGEAAAKKAVNDTPRTRERGISLTPRLPIRAARKGSKQALLIDMLAQGTTMKMLSEALKNHGGKAWTDVSIKTGFNWDVNHEKGYGVATEFVDEPSGMVRFSRADADEMLAEAQQRTDGKCVPRAVYFLVLPEGMEAPMPHTERQAPAPKVVKEKVAKAPKAGGASRGVGRKVAANDVQENEGDESEAAA